MADLDDLREGADFGLGINCENQSFHVKGVKDEAKADAEQKEVKDED